ncbi:serine/threonine protein kinase [Nocardioides anomalus]|uniref:non-specific serine/threonine protein kinase n=1 Tax=Nocardioides anomalus TaxID=2712223 RepID=A0A6G6WIP0_9ACTN|nr:serine/threonine-protein kinase [Nocardioides anomalus]QIG45198.1 serine/threonine protein kinase [Nocardioides anomalus]
MLRRHRPLAGRFVLLEEIGRGGTATVHRARDLQTRRHVAAKVGRPQHLSAEREHRVEHPHVLPALAWAATDDVAVLATELVAAGTLQDRLRRGPLPPAEVTRLLGQLLDALVAVHASGLVHGDVKPANLLLRDGHHLLLADFGVSTRAGEAAPLSGTPSHLAPERQAGAPPHPSQDVYAAGLVARRALGAPAPLLTLCDSMTRREADKRPTAAQAGRRLRELSGPC